MQNKSITTKIKAFSKKAAEEIIKIEAKINESIAKDAETIDSILLEVFSNENTFNGDVKNKVFFTYSNHYRGNSGTWMSVGCLSHPHNNYEDRGYIKGVATDLNGYVKLKSLLTVCENYNPLYLYEPKFRDSKNKSDYDKKVSEIKADFAAKLKTLAERQVEKANEVLKLKTDLSLKYYMRDI